jgi:signal transduction histidine kinase
MSADTRDTTAGEPDARAVFAGRIDILYTLGRHFLSLPFAALCMVATLVAAEKPTVFIITPLFFQITVAIAAEQLTTAYKHRASDSAPEFWARRYVFVSAIAGATWGVGAYFWFVPNSFAAQAYLTLAFLGMTAIEFIARSAHRPAYLAHAAFALTPLVLLLLAEATLYAAMSAALVVLFAAVLSTYSDSMCRLIDECVKLRFVNAGLVDGLKREKGEAEAARDEAHASAQAKEVFIANISHELRTPMNALLGMAQLLEQAGLKHPQNEHVKVMLEAGAGLKTLLDDVITLTKNETPSGREICDPVQAVRTVARLAQPRAWEKQINLNVSIMPGVPPIAADPRRVRQVLLKLVDNALKFTDRGSVDIRIENDTRSADEGSGEGACVRFTVADTGHGIPAEIAPKLFKPFSTGDESYARSQQGAGLGLAVAKRIVDSLGGVISFESEAGAGAAFSFALPVAQQARSGQEIDAAHGALPPSNLRLLLFAPEARATLTERLEPFDNHLVFADDMAGAAALASREPFDAIIVTAKHADTIAAAPGVRAPILAFVSPGEHEPHGAHAVMNWPEGAGVLYATLHALTKRARGDEEMEKKRKPEVANLLDAAAMSDLEKSVGFKTLIDILQTYIQTAEDLCQALFAATERSDWEDAARVAQDIAGSAGGLGLLTMTASARGFASAARAGEDAHRLRNRAQSILFEHHQVKRALVNLYPTLAA